MTTKEEPKMEDETCTFAKGDHVRKFKGTYVAEGVVRAVFETSLGKELVVFEFDSHPGMIHIFSPNQLEHIT